MRKIQATKERSELQRLSQACFISLLLTSRKTSAAFPDIQICDDCGVHIGLKRTGLGNRAIQHIANMHCASWL
jgi:hypothetical protein